MEGLKKEGRIVGLNQTLKALEDGKAKEVFLARDADHTLRTAVLKGCTNQGVPVKEIDSMKLLGRACGIDVKAAVACIVQ